ncbi:MAG: hypothetical protein WCV73_05275 [Patescibacteria group bacterium]|jgi:hypothetical protein
MPRKKPFSLHSGKAYGERSFNGEYNDGTINDKGADLVVYTPEGRREVFPKQEGHTALSVYAKISQTKKIPKMKKTKG